jgi:predicted aminopeptidase
MQAPAKKIVRVATIVIAAILIAQLPACYYMQAVRGHLDLMKQRRPLNDVIADQDSPQALRTRLEIAREARNFAVQELLLPDNDSYRFYAELGREYVVWNVFAAGEFSLEAKRWCFPVAGCVAYRGYFSEDAATKFAEKLARKGYDIVVGGVSAYSTLGKFADPVLSTMLRWSDSELVSTIFHELAHQKLYVKDDTAFNESFATAVANEGIARWLASRDESSSQERRLKHNKLRSNVMMLVRGTREELAGLYGSDADVDIMRAEKRDILEQLSLRAGELIEQSGTGAENWLASPLNNARLVSLGLYQDGQNAFSRILADCGGELSCFYAATQALADLPADERKQKLVLLGD